MVEDGGEFAGVEVGGGGWGERDAFVVVVGAPFGERVLWSGRGLEGGVVVEVCVGLTVMLLSSS